MNSASANPYDFILNNQPIPPKSGLAGDFKKRLIVVAGGGIVLIVLLIVVFSVILGGGKQGANELYQVAAAQQDIIELTNSGLTIIRDAQLLSTTTTVNVVIISQNNDTKSLIKELGFGGKSATLINAKRNKQFKTALDEAKTSGTYEASFKAILSNRLDLYRSYLQSAYAVNTVQSAKKSISAWSTQADNLVVKE